MSEYRPSKLRLNYSYYLAKFLRKRQNGADPHPPFPLSQGEGGKLERRGGQAGKGEGVLFELYFGVHSYLEVAIVFDFDFDGID